MKQHVVVFALAFAMVRAEMSCDDGGAMPHQLRINKKGHPSLSCTRPQCLDVSPEKACNAPWITGVCDGKDEFTAGLREINQGDYNTLETKCCKLDSRLQIASTSSVTLRLGGNFLGVEESHDGMVTAFELVKEVYRQTTGNNSIQFVVTIAQVECVGNSAAEEKTEILHEMEKELSKAKGTLKKLDKHLNKKPIQSAIYRQQAHPKSKAHGAATHSGEADEYSKVGLTPIAGSETDSNEEGASDKQEEYADTPAAEEGYQAKSAPVPPPAAPYQAPAAPSYNAAPQPQAASYNAAPQYAAPQQHQQSYAQPSFGLPQPSYAQPQASYAQPQASYAQPHASYAQPQASYAQSYAAAPAYDASSYYPSGCDSMTSCIQCFSGDMEVQTSEGLKQMKDIKIGDMVLSHEENMISYSPVIMFLHRLPEEHANFRLIQTEQGHSLKLTDWHLVYTVDCDSPQAVMTPEHASDVKIGECLAVNADGTFKLAKINNITMVEADGIYAPLTASGDIVVNDILASCHSNVNVQGLQQSFFGWMHIIKDFFGMPVDVDGRLPTTVESLISAMEWIMPAKAF